MRVLGWLLLASVVLTVVRWAVTLGAIIILLVVVIALVRAPAKALAVLAGWLLLCAFAAHPALGLILFILVAAGGMASRER